MSLRNAPAAVHGQAAVPAARPAAARRRRGRLTAAGAEARRVPAVVWLFLLLGAGAELFWVAWPTISTFYYSFTHWDGIGTKQFIGLANYRALFSDPVFGKAFTDTLIWVAGFGTLSLVLGFAFALALNRPRPGVSAYRALIYLPLVFSLVVTGLFWQTMYRPGGPLDTLLRVVGLGSLQQQWLTDPHLVLYALLVAAVWHEVGYIMVLYLAGLKATDPSLDEAAQIDGAGQLHRLFRITLPQLREVNLIVLAIIVIDSLRTFDIVWVMTGGGPDNASQLLSTDMYTEAFTNLQVGYASAIAVIIFLLTVGFIVFLVSRMVSSGGSR
jgi:multiple sugar transport system permease protein